ncbi:YIP1 family protein [Staphylococcus xylosus]|uniref:YIP1 family protein n=1 Tax=Staphylococcus xylosus TaxID=1288 RepID=UPI001AADDD55|nr:YIP1 family protein [Staphylococcus xylosus]MBO3075864.1 YIP1 family protein [Staphylococcus xylosus]MBV5141363.1 YIP1 family protein [Staphylococcus xylosus]MBW3126566.1 YIP1 family protein [Staphylococcus xylosus]
MESSKFPFVSYFSELRNNPKWGLKLILSIVVMTLSAAITAFTIDYSEQFKDTGMSGEQLEQAKMFGQIVGAIGGVFGAIFSIGITFVIFLLISKIMKSDASGKSIFSATISYTLITGIIALIVVLIQWIAGLSPSDYSITSLNIFDKGNKILGAFNLQTLIGAYVFGVMLFATNRFSKKSTLIWSIIYIVVLTGFTLLSAAFA